MDVTIGWKPFTCDFQGRKVAMRVRPLRRHAALKLLPYLKKSADAAGDTYRLVADTLEMQELAPEVLPEHVQGLELTVDGQPADFQTMAEEAVLAPLVGSIVAELVRISFFAKADEKNSGGPSAG